VCADDGHSLDFINKAFVRREANGYWPTGMPHKVLAYLRRRLDPLARATSPAASIRGRVFRFEQ